MMGTYMIGDKEIVAKEIFYEPLHYKQVDIV